MDHTLPARLGRTLPRVALAAGALVLAGCGPGHGDPPVTETGGAVLTAGKLEGKAGESVTFQAVGSELANSDGTCPEHLFFFVDDAEKADAEATPQTLAGGGSCKVTSGAATLPLPAGTPGTTRDQKVSVMVEGTNADGDLYKSTAHISIKVTTEAPGSTPSTPTTPHTPTTPTGPHGCATDAHPAGAAPVPDYVLNPTPPVVGRAIELDGSPSHDPDGSIAGYRWDWGNDGTWDATTREATYTPTAAGDFAFCLEVTDDAGNKAYHQVTVPVSASSTVTPKPFGVSPSGGGSTNVHVFPDTTTGADLYLLWVDGEQVDSVMSDTPHLQFDKGPGRHEVDVHYVDTASGDGGAWRKLVDVSGTRRVVATASAKQKRYTVSALLEQGRDKVLAAGKRRYADGVLSVDDVIVASRSKGKLSKKQSRKLPKKLRNGLKALYNADFVARFSGRRVVLTPDAWGLAGTGTMLARSRASRKTLVCLSVTTDGASVAGTTFKVLGATGKASRLSGSGLYPPPVLGPRPGEKPAGTAVVSLGSKKGISKCRSLVRHLPKAKKRKGR